MVNIVFRGSASKDSPIYTGGIIVSTVRSYRPTAEELREEDDPERGGGAPVRADSNTVLAIPPDGADEEE